MSIDENIFQSILPEMTSSQPPACADVVRQGGKGDMSQNITHIDTVGRYTNYKKGV
ncbi:MAG: hypothetical protein IIB44_09045 [Candidatus Marinimicrobia bacterium]|nr:hypothetical protein [Candidatus Neomarinimicrobiota bacterium]MCH8068163.1 hypothetical protein [Candidatus Neomarinimicrobiota bacterium]